MLTILVKKIIKINFQIIIYKNIYKNVFFFYEFNNNKIFN